MHIDFSEYTNNYLKAKHTLKSLWLVVSKINEILQRNWFDEKKLAEFNVMEALDLNDTKIGFLIIKYLLEMDYINKLSLNNKGINEDDILVVSDPINYLVSAYDLFGDIFTKDDIVDIARSSIINRYSIKYCSETIKQFANYSELFNKNIPLNEPMSIETLHSILSNVDDNEQEYVKGFFKVLLLERIIIYSFKNPLFYIRRGHIYYFHIVNKLFGLKYDIPGLNFLFENGLLIPYGDGLSMLITGGPGTGKTTLALELSKETAKQGGISIFFTTEQAVKSLVHAIAIFNWENNYRFDVFTDIKELNNIDIEIEREKGILLLSSFGKYDFKDIISNIKFIIEKIQTSRISKKMIVIDSLTTLNFKETILKQNDIIVENNENDLAIRNQVERLFLLMRENGIFGIFTSEKGYDNKISEISEFLSDVLIEVSTAKEEDDYSIRQINIKKCRSQHIQRGFHHFSINRETGIEIYPSCSAILSAREGRERSIIRDDSYIDVKVPGFCKIIGSGILRNTTTSVIGDPGTGKSILLQHIFFCEDNHRNRSVPETYLIISFRDDKKKIEKRLNRILSIRNLFHKVIKTNIKLEFLCLRQGYISPGMLLSKILKIIEDCKDKGERVRRVLVDDLGQLSQKYPLISKQEMFLPTMIEIFNTENITSLFSCSSYRELKQNIELQIMSFSDYLFYSRSQMDPKEHIRKIYLSAIKSFKRTHSNREMEMIITKEGVEIIS